MPVITKEETKLIGDSWELVTKDTRNHGIAFFKHFFATQPDVKAKYFPEMTGDEQMGNHGVRVLNAVGAMVKHCKNEDDEKLVKKIHEIVDNHKPRSVGVPQFELVLKVLLEYLGIALGSNLSADGAAAWQNLAKAFVSVADARIKSGDSQ